MEDIDFASADCWNGELFCSGLGVLPGKLGAPGIGLIDEDEPRHGEMRSLINRGFTPRMVGYWEEAFQKITDETLDAISARGECDCRSSAPRCCASDPLRDERGEGSAEDHSYIARPQRHRPEFGEARPQDLHTSARLRRRSRRDWPPPPYE